ncbi:hypothetical protein F53441_3181 [Fusarium austroafricanum]|uniref:ARC105/Med15 mediator subunit central domain-containing protein n=1 Tax=Fusarium austroafricanum TaxID=2364996 RepID=A0A8H4KQH3_9HYPO|nr:hypothetical protein F53441_3181 [Fusarium austroafricanum]
MASREELTDTDIVAKLNVHFKRDSKLIKISNASRNFHRLTNQWPWEWISEVSPDQWSVDIIDRMHTLVGVLRDSGYITEQARIFLWGMAEGRKKFDQYLKASDIFAALHHFQPDRFRAGFKPRVRPARTTRSSRDTSVTGDSEAELDEINRDHESIHVETGSTFSVRTMTERDSLQRDASPWLMQSDQTIKQATDSLLHNSDVNDLSKTLAAMKERESKLQVAVKTFQAKRDALRIAIKAKEASFQQLNLRDVLQGNIESLRQMICKLSENKKEIEMTSTLLEKLKIIDDPPVDHAIKALENCQSQLRANEKEMAEVEISLNETTEALNRNIETEQLLIREKKLLETFEMVCDGVYQELQGWRALTRTMHDSHSKMAVLNEAFAQEGISLEGLFDQSVFLREINFVVKEGDLEADIERN